MAATAIAEPDQLGPPWLGRAGRRGTDGLLWIRTSFLRPVVSGSCAILTGSEPAVQAAACSMSPPRRATGHQARLCARNFGYGLASLPVELFDADHHGGGLVHGLHDFGAELAASILGDGARRADYRTDAYGAINGCRVIVACHEVPLSGFRRALSQGSLADYTTRRPLGLLDNQSPSCLALRVADCELSGGIWDEIERGNDSAHNVLPVRRGSVEGLDRHRVSSP